MAKMMVVFRIYPNDGEFDKAYNNVKEQLKPQSMQAEEVAFGIKLILALFTFDDVDNSSSKIEDSIKKLDGVNEVEVKEESLL
jgi:translation elongation factor EF-1beta